MDILGDDNPQDDNKFRNGRVIYDTYDDESDNLSSFSKHETDVSNDNSRSQGNDKVVKRKNVPIKEEPALDKKVKRDSAYQNGHKIKTGA